MEQLRRLVGASFIATVGAMALSTSVGAKNPTTITVEAYGGDIVFDVLRDGTLVGDHVVTFDDGRDGLVVYSRLSLQIRLLFFTAYSYRYESRSIWRDGRLGRLKATVNDDGKKSAVNVTAIANRLSITGPNGEASVHPPIFPTDHGNPGVLQHSRVLNTITGSVNAVTIKPIRAEIVETERGPVAATRYAYTGELETEVLYDDMGRWVGMAFKGRDGSTIEYVCRRCQGGMASLSAP